MTDLTPRGEWVIALVVLALFGIAFWRLRQAVRRVRAAQSELRLRLAASSEPEIRAAIRAHQYH